MERLGAWLAGHNLPGTAELTEAAVAVGLSALVLALGWYAGHRLGDRVAQIWIRHVDDGEAFAVRVCKILRYGVSLLLLALIAEGWRWQFLAALCIGLAEASSAAMFAIAALRTLHMPRWAARSVAVLAFAAILTHAIGGFEVAQAALDRVGVQIGHRRLTLLSLVQVGTTFILLYAVVRGVNRLVAHWIGETKGFDPTQKLLFQKLASIAIVVIAFFVGIDMLEIDLTAFTVFSGAFGLAIGFGMQKTIGNLIAGIILLMDRSIKPGDVIVVGDSFGWVNRIGVRAVSIVTRDGKEHLIPNENLMTQEVENWSYTDRNVRIRIPVTVAYDSDLKLAQDLMLRAAIESTRVLDSPKPAVWLLAFGENGVQHEIRVWINDPESGVGSVRSDVLCRLWALFKQHGVTIPAPQREVRLVRGDKPEA